MLISNDLFENVLVNPMLDGAGELCVVSGFATAAMAFRHMQYAKEKEHNIKVRLLVGMCPSAGMPVSNHHGLKKLVEDDFRDSFMCSYIAKPPAVHSKTYVWLRDGEPVFGFVGSANYTQTAFGEKQREVMTPCDPDSAYQYYHSLVSDSIYCTHNDVDDLISVYREQRERHETSESETLPPEVSGLERVKVSLLTKDGRVPPRSGLNWGQRSSRDPNQAYLSLRAEVYSTDFFPERGTPFTVLTDDGKTIICSRAQDHGKGIHTPHNNALLGEYFRNRLGLASGALVYADDLRRYGRSDVHFYKIDDETYYMDFSTK